MRESDFQSKLIKELRKRFPGCLITKTDPTYIQGLPDLLILYGSQWAALECKNKSHAHVQANQPYYVDLMGHMSFARFIYPENKEDVLDDLQQTFGA